MFSVCAVLLLQVIIVNQLWFVFAFSIVAHLAQYMIQVHNFLLSIDESDFSKLTGLNVNENSLCTITLGTMGKSDIFN